MATRDVSALVMIMASQLGNCVPCSLPGNSSDPSPLSRCEVLPSFLISVVCRDLQSIKRLAVNQSLCSGYRVGL